MKDAAVLFVIVLVALLLVGGTIADLVNSNTAGANCQKASYAGYVYLAGERYCYRLEGDTGTLILANKFKR